MIFGFFGLGIMELIILGVLALGAVGVVLYFTMGSGKSDE